MWGERFVSPEKGNELVVAREMNPPLVFNNRGSLFLLWILKRGVLDVRERERRSLRVLMRCLFLIRQEERSPGRQRYAND